MRESSKLDKTKLPGDTYEKWLGTNRERSKKTRGSETPAPDSYDVWVGKLVETKLKSTKTV
ncbi:MAG TPA: hypothetical protein VLY82_07280 [Nitrososphaerales archaeon]|nr:hypothetical protein [Nitrososphaerales archaeon]